MTDQASAVHWGPAIPVDGKRPEWLTGGIDMRWAIIHANGSYSPYQPAFSSSCTNWTGEGHGVAIRLPASHFYYASEAFRAVGEKPSPTPPPIPPEVVRKTLVCVTEAEVRQAAVAYGGDSPIARTAYEDVHRHLGLILPEPVDPDVLVVRQIMHAQQRAMTPPDSGWGNMSYLKGSYDDTEPFKAALAAYRGRALAAAEREG